MSKLAGRRRARAKKILAELAAPARPVAGPVLIFTEPPGAARRGPAGLPEAFRRSLL